MIPLGLHHVRCPVLAPRHQAAQVRTVILVCNQAVRAGVLYSTVLVLVRLVYCTRTTLLPPPINQESRVYTDATHCVSHARVYIKDTSRGRAAMDNWNPFKVRDRVC